MGIYPTKLPCFSCDYLSTTPNVLTTISSSLVPDTQQSPPNRKGVVSDYFVRSSTPDLNFASISRLVTPALRFCSKLAQLESKNT